ncbi:uncharacterized protein LOC111909408 [Lactuca sativa]|uniref:uncharacterized protein LOC111909408 n=1 Tax=Lactuca sativa TaxID=4236 RepID=UPI000CD992AB|nr:uncharacterized protein LOC111909408 [Lactuca sativa]
MKASSLRREIIGIKQHKREAFHTYWEKFKKLCVRCPNHGLTEYQILQYFIEGMTPMERRLLNGLSGGSLPDKTPTEIRNLIKNMAEDSKQSSHDEEWYTDAPRGVKEVQTTQIEAQLSELTKAEDISGQTKGDLSSHGLTKDGTTIKVGEEINKEIINQIKHINTNKNHPFPQNQQRPPFQPQNFQPRHPPQPPPQAGSSSMSLEDIVKSLATNTQSFQQETKASIKSLEQQVSQLAQSVSKMESQGKLPSQTEKNLKYNACAITLRGEKSYEGPRMSDEEEEEKEIEVEEAVKEEERKNNSKSKKPIETEVKVTPAPFPSRLTNTKREWEDDEIMAMFRKVEINIPLLDAITQIPRYAKFLKELCTSKKKLKGNQTMKVRENVSAVLPKRLPKKCKDPGVFTVPCKMGNLFVLLEHQLMFYPTQSIKQ